MGPILVKTLILQSWQVGAAGHKVSIEQWMLSGAKAHFGPISGGWLYTLGYIAVCWLILWQLYRRRVFLRV